MLLIKQQWKRDAVTKMFIQKNSYQFKETIGHFKLIAEIFNNFFTKSRPKIATEIETPAKSFGLYLK